MPPQRRQQHVDQTHTYIRMFCGSLCGFSLLMLICVSPLNWVQFLVIKNGLQLYSGLWISCSHELCWSHTLKPPYNHTQKQYGTFFIPVAQIALLSLVGVTVHIWCSHILHGKFPDLSAQEACFLEPTLWLVILVNANGVFSDHNLNDGRTALLLAILFVGAILPGLGWKDYLQYSRAFFLISVLTILIGLGWLLSSCLPRRGSRTTNLDLKVSMLSFISAICLLLCLILFLAQVHWHTRDAMESDLLWPYYLNWWSDLLYIFSGIISFLNYLTFRSPPLDQNVTVIPTEKSRLGIGPVTTVSSAENEGTRSEMGPSSDGEEKLPNAELPNTEM